MPQLGQQSGDVGLGAAVLEGPGATQELLKFHKNRERERMNIPEEPDPIIQLSEDQRVFIYNVGPWRFQQSLASYGEKTIQALAEDRVLASDDVAGPLVIDGLPREYYPAEGEAKVIYHRPLKNRGRQSKRPGFDFAMEVIGCGMMVNPSCDLRNFGVFISDYATKAAGADGAVYSAPVKPEKGSTQDAWKAWEAFIKDVNKAKDLLRKKLARMCEEANLEYARGNFASVKNDQMYQAARLLKKTELDCVWLKDTAEQSAKESCGGCGKTIKIGILRCECGYRVCDDETWEKVKKRYE